MPWVAILFACQDWHQLHADLANISKGLVSLSVVTDPFGEYNQILLNRCFPDLAVPFKQHFVVDLRRQPEQFVHSHHLRNARKALNVLRVEACDDPSHFLDDWVVLYAKPNSSTQDHRADSILARIVCKAIARTWNRDVARCV